MKDDQEKCLAAGANDYILKTTPPPVLLARLRVQFRQQGLRASQPLAPSPPPQRLQFGRIETIPVDERHPLRAGDVVACPPGGPDSAHQIRNTSVDAELRYLAVSTTQSPDMFHYPDSGKTGASHYAGDGDVIRLRNRIDHNLDYWDGE